MVDSKGQKTVLAKKNLILYTGFNSTPFWLSLNKWPHFKGYSKYKELSLAYYKKVDNFSRSASERV